MVTGVFPASKSAPAYWQRQQRVSAAIVGVLDPLTGSAPDELSLWAVGLITPVPGSLQANRRRRWDPSLRWIGACRPRHFLVMGGDEKCRPLLLVYLPDQGHDSAGRFTIEVSGRLVRENAFRTVHQSPRDRDALFTHRRAVSRESSFDPPVRPGERRLHAAFACRILDRNEAGFPREVPFPGPCRVNR